MTDKKKTIKMIALILVSIIFLVMVYVTFFKSKKSPAKPAAKNQPQIVSVPIPEPAIAVAPDTVEARVKGFDNAQIVENIPPVFESIIENIFEPSDIVITALKKKLEKPKPVFVPPKRVVKIKKLPPLSEQEKAGILQTLQYKGSILSNSSSVAIINGEFIHEGDTIKGYKVTSISEKQVNIDTGRGMITLEIMKHE